MTLQQCLLVSFILGMCGTFVAHMTDTYGLSAGVIASFSLFTILSVLVGGPFSSDEA